MTSPRLPGDVVEFIVIGALVLFSLLSLDFFSDVAAFYPSRSVLVPLLPPLIFHDLVLTQKAYMPPQTF